MDEGKAAKLVKTLAGHKDIKAVALNPIADALHVPTTCTRTRPTSSHS